MKFSYIFVLAVLFFICSPHANAEWRKIEYLTYPKIAKNIRPDKCSYRIHYAKDLSSQLGSPTINHIYIEFPVVLRQIVATHAGDVFGYLLSSPADVYITGVFYDSLLGKTGADSSVRFSLSVVALQDLENPAQSAVSITFAGIGKDGREYSANGDSLAGRLLLEADCR